MSFLTHAFQHGDWQFTAIQDGASAFAAQTFFPKTDPARVAAIMGAFGLETSFPVSINILLAQRGDDVVLVDTGTGRDVGAGEGQLLASLARLGVTAADIDAIIITHAHFDHIGGAVTASGQLHFPQAHHHLPAAEWAYWTDPETVAQASGPSAPFAATNLPRLREHGSLFAPGDTIRPGIRAVAAPGHTPGHIGLRFESGTGSLLHIADAAHHPLQLTHPDLPAAFDVDQARGIATRRQLWADAAKADDLVLAYHFPFPGLGHVRTSASGHEWQPAS